MGKCSYTLNEWWKCPEQTWKGSEKYCIFHDPSPEKDTELFKQKMKEKLDNEDYEFRGYCFPEKLDFSHWKFEKYASFSDATFQEYADFSDATFQKKADFSFATFQKKADFSFATFQKKADFSFATFQKDADFSRATFQNAYFVVATFQEYADFSGDTFQDASFSEATFQKKADFSGDIFQDASFSEATFQKKADFSGDTFQKKADFGGATFKYANFVIATFQEYADFSGDTFQKKADFIGVTFQKDANFYGAVIERNLEFTPIQINKLDLRYAQFLFKGHITADLTEAKFHRADLENVAFTDCTWPKKIYEEIHMDDEILIFGELETIYRNLKQSMQRQGDYSKAGDFYYRELEMRRKGTKNKERRLWLELYNLLAGYGEKPVRTAFSSLLTIFVFAFLYWLLGCLQYPMRNPTPLEKIGSTVYFSFVTFTTLGLGDIEPINFFGRTLICCEAVIGAFLIALFVVVFARKMMR